jgi:hypothetical protein
MAAQAERILRHDVEGRLSVKLSAGGELAAAEEFDDFTETASPLFHGVGRIGPDGLEVERDGVAFLRIVEVDECRTQYHFEYAERARHRGSEPDEAIEHLLLAMAGGEDGAVAPEDVDVAGESCSGEVFGDVEVVAQGLELVFGECPGVALSGKDGRSRGVEGTKRLQERRMVFGFGDGVELVGFCAKIDELSGALGIFPGDDEDRIVGGALG